MLRTGAVERGERLAAVRRREVRIGLLGTTERVGAARPACSKRVSFETQTPNVFAPPPNAWVNAALPIFARSAAQSLLAA